MTYSTTTIRPGFLVSFKTRVRGNVRYFKRVIDEKRVDDTGAEHEKWETERLVTDAAEAERAKKARSKCSSIVRGACTPSADFGLLCPLGSKENLDRAVADARAIANEFNSTATFSRVEVYVMTGTIADNDVEAIKSINSEVRVLMETMKTGLEKLDVEVVRDAAARAKKLGNMLAPDAEAKVRIAVETARKASRDIVKASEEGVAEIDRAAINKIMETRTSFLDMDDEQAAIARPVVSAPAVDLEVEA